MSKMHASQHEGSDAVESAIAEVLRAERDAALAIEAARSEAGHRAEAARAAARALADRTERRIRAVVGAFERELAARLARIDADGAAVARPHLLNAEEHAELQRAVARLARQLIGGAP